MCFFLPIRQEETHSGSSSQALPRQPDVIRIEFNANEVAAELPRDQGSCAAAHKRVKHDASLRTACQNRCFNQPRRVDGAMLASEWAHGDAPDCALVTA